MVCSWLWCVWKHRLLYSQRGALLFPNWLSHWWDTAINVGLGFCCSLCLAFSFYFFICQNLVSQDVDGSFYFLEYYFIDPAFTDVKFTDFLLISIQCTSSIFSTYNKMFLTLFVPLCWFKSWFLPIWVKQYVDLEEEMFHWVEYQKPKGENSFLFDLILICMSLKEQKLLQ